MVRDGKAAVGVLSGTDGDRSYLVIGGGAALGVLSGTGPRSYCWVFDEVAVAWRGVLKLPCVSSRGLLDTMLWIFALVELFNLSL